MLNNLKKEFPNFVKKTENPDVNTIKIESDSEDRYYDFNICDFYIICNLFKIFIICMSIIYTVISKWLQLLTRKTKRNTKPSK